MDRREFLRLAAGGVAAAALPACGSGSGKPKAERAASGKRPKLRIAQWTHFVPTYDAWFDDEYTKRWGDEHDVDVLVDHIPYAQMIQRADTEVAARRGHDLFEFVIPAARFADDVIDHADIVAEIESRAGSMAAHIQRTVRDPRTQKYLGVPEFWAAQPANYRTDLWQATGLAPSTWPDVLRAAPELRDAGHPIGFGFSEDIDSAVGLTALLLSFGASIQDEVGNLLLGGAATVDAVKSGVDLFRRGMTPDVLTWDALADNRFLASGQCSFTLDAVSALRAIEQQDPDLAAKIALAPSPSGPAGSLTPTNTHTYVIWKFAEQPELAGQFLVDLLSDYREPLTRSLGYNLPGFPGAAPDLSGLLAAEADDKYRVLADAASWTTNFGHPGHDNAAVDEVVHQWIVSRMFAAAARGEKTPEQAVADAAAEARPIFDKWRERGKI